MSNRKRIAIITHGGIGGGHRGQGIPVMMQLVAKLANEFDVTVFSLTQLNKGFIPPNYTVKTLPVKDSTNLYLKLFLLLLILLKTHISKPFSLFQAYWGFPGGVLAAIMGKLTGKPVVTTFKGAEVVNLPEISYGLLASKQMCWLLKQVTKHSDCLVAQSNYHLEKIKESGLPYNQLTIIYGGVNTCEISINVTKLLIPPYQFFHAANLNLVKDQTTLLHAFKILSSQIDCVLHIAGFDTLHGQIQLLSKDLGLSEKVVFHGMLTFNELQTFYQQAHIFLLTSLSESQALVVNEAMANGCVVCGTRVGLLADLEDKATLAVEIKNAKALANKVLALLQNDTQYKLLQAFGKEWSFKHDINYTVKAYSNLYHQLTQ
ncbi:MAG: glycosyltransferase family 4 protein [Flavobacterium sp.]|nr:glycosyltransferase family 4 protein [Flavobacterium sp.]